MLFIAAAVAVGLAALSPPKAAVGTYLSDVPTPALVADADALRERLPGGNDDAQQQAKRGGRRGNGLHVQDNICKGSLGLLLLFVKCAAGTGSHVGWCSPSWCSPPPPGFSSLPSHFPLARFLARLPPPI